MGIVQLVAHEAAIPLFDMRGSDALFPNNFGEDLLCIMFIKNARTALETEALQQLEHKCKCLKTDISLLLSNSKEL